MRTLLFTLFAGFLASCGSGGGSEIADGSGGSSGTLRVLLTDSPVDDADSVFVTIDRVQVVRIVDGEDVIDTIIDQPQEFDLLTLQNDVTAVLAETELEPGDYAGLRLIVADTANRIIIGPDSFPLRVPSGPQTGIKLNLDFTIAIDVVSELTIDFNVRKSVVKRGRNDDYLLTPSLTLVETITSGAIAGSVASSDADNPLQDAVVSVQQDGEELLSVLLTAGGAFRLAPLLEGDYDIVISATGCAPQAVTGVEVTAAQETGVGAVALDPAGTGGIAGIAPTGEGYIVVLRWEGHFLSQVAPDPDTGEFRFDDIAEGTYDLVLSLNGGEVARLDDVSVLPDGETGDLELVP